MPLTVSHQISVRNRHTAALVKVSMTVPKCALNCSVKSQIVYAWEHFLLITVKYGSPCISARDTQTHASADTEASPESIEKGPPVERHNAILTEELPLRRSTGATRINLKRATNRSRFQLRSKPIADTAT